MGIAVHQIHNLVRTYQRALQPAHAEHTAAQPSQGNDRVSVSAEARERHESVIPEHGRDNRKRTT